MADLTREDVVDYIKNKVSLESADLSGMDLRGIDFSKVNLSRADLTECRLAGSRLSEANLSHVKASEADLSGCNLSGANLSHGDFHKTSFYESNMVYAKALEADFHLADLCNSDCSTADFAKSNFQHAKCCSTDFRKTVLAGADFREAMLRGALFRGANLKDANLEGAPGLDPAILQGHAGPEEDVEPPKRLMPGLTPGADRKPAVDYKTLRPLAGGAAAAPKASKYHPPLRNIPAVIFTTGGWIRGIFHIPVMHGFLEHINLSGEMLRLTQVTLPYLNLELHFFGLKRSKALLILPDCDPKLLRLPESTADYHVHRVSFLLEGGTITGSLAIEEDIRVSDYLANHDKFALLRNCRFGAHETPVEEESHFPLVLVNCNAVVGASDERLRK